MHFSYGGNPRIVETQDKIPRHQFKIDLELEKIKWELKNIINIFIIQSHNIIPKIIKTPVIIIQQWKTSSRMQRYLVDS